MKINEIFFIVFMIYVLILEQFIYEYEFLLSDFEEVDNRYAVIQPEGLEWFKCFI